MQIPPVTIATRIAIARESSHLSCRRCFNERRKRADGSLEEFVFLSRSTELCGGLR
jgi:hypothetical protein